MKLEGIVSKRLGSRYRSGRSKDRLKFKNPEARCGGTRFCSMKPKGDCQINATRSPEDRQSLRSQIPLTLSCSPTR
jgi:ATP-dependent DNA ligase